jgi:hypothetical protein
MFLTHSIYMRFFTFFLICFGGCSLFCNADTHVPIDRHALVTRHNIDWPSLEGQIPLGNGNFAFNADGTGLETVSGNTMSHWCWHKFPLPAGVTPDDIKPWATSDRGRLQGKTTPPDAPIAEWQKNNPQPVNLGRLGFIDEKGDRLKSSNVQVQARQLNLWTGLHTSRFTYDGEEVLVETCVDPKSDTVAIHAVSPLFKDGRLQIMLDFPSPGKSSRPTGKDFSSLTGHQTDVIHCVKDRLEVKRAIDDATYQAALAGDGFTVAPGSTQHQFVVTANAGTDTISLTCRFGIAAATDPRQKAQDIAATCADWWPAFWNSGGAIDLSGSKDPRWKELERRIVLSQYQLAVQSAGDYPPAEVGLTRIDTWASKWHFEMIWWHLAHYALWDRWSMPEKALGIYQSISPVARAIAENFDYKGLMWPKTTGPDGYNDGYPPEMALLWKEPHPIFFAELEYRLHPTAATLAKWREIVFGTAEFMADYPTRDAVGQYNLDPVWPATEGGGPLRRNTVFEIGYWQVALEMAQQWRLRLGLGREPHWDEVINRLAPLPTKDGFYIFSDDRPDTFKKRQSAHIDMLGIIGMLPPFKGFDPEIAHRTVVEVARDWNWDKCWGWDFPWMAMAAARVCEPQLAIDALFNPSVKNRYDERGLCTGGPSPYLPGNGGLLYAVAMMAAGWDGAPDRPAPGFPDDGSWTVRWEGLKKAP